MKMGNLQRVMMRTGLTVAAALMLSTASFAQEVSEEIVLNPVDHVVEIMPVDNSDDAATGDEGIAVGEPDPNDGDPDVVIDDGAFIPGDPGDDDGTIDDGTIDDGTGDDGTIDDGTIDDGTIDDGTGDDGTGDDGTIDDGTGGDGTVDVGAGEDGDDGMVWIGGDPDFCESCVYDELDIPVEIYQMSAGGVTDLPTVAPEQQRDTVAAKPRTSTKRPTATSNNATALCLQDHPQSPWLCEWQNGVGQ